MAPRIGLLDLPRDVALRILDKLTTLDDLVAVARSSRGLYWLAFDASLWRRITLRFPYSDRISTRQLFALVRLATELESLRIGRTPARVTGAPQSALSLTAVAACETARGTLKRLALEGPWQAADFDVALPLLEALEDVDLEGVTFLYPPGVETPKAGLEFHPLLSLLRLPRLRRLRCVSGAAGRDAVVPASLLTAWGRLLPLESLECTVGGESSAAVEAALSRLPTSLTSLDVRLVARSPDPVLSAACVGHLSGLESLSLAAPGALLGDLGALAAALPRLRSLRLEAGAAAWAALAPLAGLVELALSGPALPAPAALAAAVGSAATLRVLRLGDIDPRASSDPDEMLAAAPGPFPHLEALTLILGEGAGAGPASGDLPAAAAACLAGAGAALGPTVAPALASVSVHLQSPRFAGTDLLALRPFGAARHLTVTLVPPDAAAGAPRPPPESRLRNVAALRAAVPSLRIID
eukprot:tig00000378_g24501.t1